MTDLRQWMTLCETSPAISNAGNLLLELDWYDKSPMARVLARHRGKWVHFSNGAPNRKPAASQMVPVPNKADYPMGGYDRAAQMKRYQKDLTRATRMNATQNVPKLGVNPAYHSHKDPNGIYFYPVDFILSATERLRSGQQYGLNMAYYYVVDLKLNDPNGYSLQRITWDQVEAIADRNGWAEPLAQYRALPPEEQRKRINTYGDPNRPGSVLWHFVESMVQADKISWNKAFAGITYLRDENGSIIHSNEPDQILVLNPSIITIIEQGDTKALRRDENNPQAAWMYAFTNIMKGVRGEVGGDLIYDQKKPKLVVTAGNARFVIAITDRQYDVKLEVSYTYGRAEDYFSIPQKDLEEQTQQQIVDRIANRIKKVAALKTDLTFKPAIPEAEIKTIMTNEVTTHLPLEWEVKITNSPKPDYCRMMVYGKATQDFDGLEVATGVNASLEPTQFSLHADVKLDGKWVASASSDEFSPDQRSEAYDSLADKLEQSLNLHFKAVGPENTYVDSWKRWSDPRQWQCYMGWMVLNCGIALGGRLRKRYATAVAAYDALKDKTTFERDIVYKARHF